MAPITTENDRKLIAAYIEAAERLRRLLEVSEGVRREVLVARAQPILKQLVSLSNEFMRSDLPEHYRRGSKEAITALRKLGMTSINEAFSAQHTEAVNLLVREGQDSLGRAIKAVEDNIIRGITVAERQAIVSEVITGTITGVNARKSVEDALKSQNITGIRLSNRTISVEQYAYTVVNTLTADAHNTAAVIRYAENGVGYFRRIERAEAPDRPCQWARNKVFSMELARFHTNIHPNCRGSHEPILTVPEGVEVITSYEQVPADVRKAMRI